MADDEAVEVESNPGDSQWSTGIPDDISLFPEEGKTDTSPEPAPAPEPEAKAKDDAPAPAPEPAPEVDDKPPEPKPEDKPPPSLQKMMDSIEDRDRKVTERERAVRDADKWRQQAEEKERLVQLLRDDPIRGLQSLGADVTRAFEEKLGLAEEQDPVQKMQARLEALESERAKEKETAAQQAEQDKIVAAQRNVSQRQANLVEKLSEVPLENNDFAHLVSFRQQGTAAMWNRSEDYAMRTGRWLPDDEAARQAEAQLAAEVEHVLDVASKMPQYQHRFVSNQTNGDGQLAEPAQTRRTPPGKTTSNRDTTTPPPAGKRDNSLVGATDDEVLAAGLAAYAAATRR